MSQMLTLYTTPVVYLWFERLALAVRNLRGSRQTQEEAHGALVEEGPPEGSVPSTPAR